MDLLTKYIIQYGSVALDINPTHITTLLALIHYRNMNGKSKVCNPTYDRLALANGHKNTKKISPIMKSLEDKGYIKRTPYTDAESKRSRKQYGINDEYIIALCMAVEHEWYERFKVQDEESREQAEILANPEQYTEQELQEASGEAPKAIPEGKAISPVNGRLIAANKSEPETRISDRIQHVDLLSILSNASNPSPETLQDDFYNEREQNHSYMLSAFPDDFSESIEQNLYIEPF